MCQEEAGLLRACLPASLEHQTRGQKAACVCMHACGFMHLHVGARSLAGCMCAFWASHIAQSVNHLPEMQKPWVRSVSREDPLEK